MSEKLEFSRSTNIEECEYEADAEKLVVSFKGGRVRSTYEYAAVSQATFDELKAQAATTGAGRAFDRLIKRGGFKYRKL